jgi:hypothetical protein
MTPTTTTRCRVLLATAALLTLATEGARAQDPLPAEFHGDWVPAEAACDAPTRFRVAAARMALINSPDSTSYGDVALAHSFFGPDYAGISVVAIPESNSENYPFTVYFNADEQQGVTMLDIYQPMEGPMNAQVRAIQEAARKLAERFPLNRIPLKKCPAP